MPDRFPCNHDCRQGHVLRVGKTDAGRLLDGRTWDETPEARHAS